MTCCGESRKEATMPMTLLSTRKIQNGKAAGPDGIPAEALKRDVTTSVEMLYSLFEEIWEKEEIPAEWKEGYLIN